MAAEQRVVELVVDASGAERGAQRAELAYEHMGARADAAVARANAAFDRQFTLFQSRLPRSIDAVSNAYDSLQAKIDPVFNAQLRAEREMTHSLAVINRAVMLGVTTEEQATRDILRLKQQQVEAVNRVKTAQHQANEAMLRPVAANNNRYVAQNLMFQGQDTIMTAIGGMDPKMIALQQGSQMAGAVAGMTAREIGSAAAGALTSLLSPLSLATVGFTWLAASSLQYFTRTKDGTKEAESGLRNHAALIRDIQSAYGDAASGLDNYLRASAEERAAFARLNVDDARKGLVKQTQDFVYDIMPSGGLFGRLGFDPQFEAFRKQITDLEKQARTSTPDLDAFRKSVEERVEVNPGWRSAADALLAAGQEAFNADRKFRQAETALGIIGGTAQAQVTGITALSRALQELNGLAVPALSDEGRARQLYESILQRDPNSRSAQIAYDEAMMRIANQNPFVKNSDGNMVAVPVPGEKPNSLDMDDPYSDILRSGESRLRQLRQEVESLGMTGRAAASLRYEQDALNDAYLKNLSLSDDQRLAIRKQADEYGALTEQLSRLRLLQDAQFEISQMLRGDMDKRIASQLRSAGLPVDLEGQDAALLRSVELVKQYGDTWKEVGDIGRSAIDKITDGMADGFQNFDDIAKVILTDINKQFLQLAIANPLKNGLFGDTNSTLGNIGGIGGFFSALTGGKMPDDPTLRSVSSMQVTAATVMVNGGVAGLGSLDGVTRLQSPANSNDPFAAIMPASSDMSVYARAIQSIESSGNYSALGPLTKSGDRAYGAYQVMGANIGPWTEAALGRRLSSSEFLSSQSAQDAVFNHRFGSYVDRYGASGAAQAWFGGPGSVGRGGNTADILGTTGSAYVDKFNTAVGRAVVSTEMAAEGLGTLGTGFGKMGQTLANAFPPAPASAGGGGGLFGWLGSLFSPDLSAYSGLMGKVGLFANGTNGAPAGWAWVGEDGPELMRMRGGEVIRPHAQSRNMSAAAGRPNVTRQINIVNAPPGYYPEVQEDEDEYGNEKVNVTFSKMAASEAGRTGSPLNRQLRGMGARSPRRKM